MRRHVGAFNTWWLDHNRLSTSVYFPEKKIMNIFRPYLRFVSPSSSIKIHKVYVFFYHLHKETHGQWSQ